MRIRTGDGTGREPRADTPTTIGGGARRETKADLLAAIGDGIRRLQTETDAADQAMADLHGLNRTDLRCLDLIDQHGVLTAGRLAELAHLTTGAVTAVLDRLEAASLVRRLRDPDDRRRVLVEWTPKARAALYELMAPMLEDGQRTLSRFTAEELRTIARFLDTALEVQARQTGRLRVRLTSPPRYPWT